MVSDMSELQALTAQRDSLLAKIREIEASCEGIENEHNAQRVQELNLEQAQLNAQKQELSAKLSAMNSRLSAISAEITQLSGTGIDRILEAIKNQRWYFFKNKTKVLMDRDTGFLWTNLNYFPYIADDGNKYDYETAKKIADKYRIIDGYSEWIIPSFDEFKRIVVNKDNPFSQGSNYRLKDICWWYALYNDNNMISTDALKSEYYPLAAALAMRCDILVQSDIDYENNVSPNNPNYTEKERLQFTLDLFTQNDLWPIFDDEEITELYKKIYYEKPKLMEQLQALQEEIESLQTVVLLSSTFDYTALLAKYDIKSIDSSVIKYYQAVHQWTKELLEKLDYYEFVIKIGGGKHETIRIFIGDTYVYFMFVQFFSKSGICKK